AYATLMDAPAGAALWFNRPVGPIDSVEWCLVEEFFGNHRPGELVCLPYLAEVPAGYDGVATMRLDCDEAIGSCRPLLELYASAGVPLSVAVTTGQPVAARDLELLQDVVAGSGAVLSHSVHHQPNWGGSYQCART